MSFNIPLNIIGSVATQTASKFPKVASKTSLNTQTDGNVQIQPTIRKITLDQKERFIDLITNQNFSMKGAARQVGISYSTGKKVFARFRKALQLKNQIKAFNIQKDVQSSYAEIWCHEKLAVPQVLVISTIAGRNQFKYDKR